MEYETDMVTDLGLLSDSFFLTNRATVQTENKEVQTRKEKWEHRKETVENCQKLVVRIESAGLQTLE